VRFLSSPIPFPKEIAPYKVNSQHLKLLKKKKIIFLLSFNFLIKVRLFFFYTIGIDPEK
jgi:hypothetical protein